MLENKEKKNLIRKKYIKIRNSIANKYAKSNAIFNKLINSEEYKSSKVVALYRSLDSEVDTTEMINYSLEKGKTVVLPRVFGKELKFYKINSLADDFEKSSFGVEEPPANIDNLVDVRNIDLVVVPGLCFDKSKNRLGFGKGYYDRLLGKTNMPNIAIGFEEQIMDNGNLPTTDNDIKVQKIFTDKSIYK